MRGDLVTVALQGAYGKPRPAVIIQSDTFVKSSITFLLLTGTVINAPTLRVTVHPDAKNGLKVTSQVMVDKIYTLPREKIGAAFGTLAHDTMLKVSRNLALFLGIAA